MIVSTAARFVSKESQIQPHYHIACCTRQFFMELASQRLKKHSIAVAQVGATPCDGTASNSQKCEQETRRGK